MGTLNEDLTGIKAIEDKLTANKLANFAYTDHAYENPLTEADGVEYYNVDNEQNIPVPDPSVMDVNETVLTKGFRSQASSIPRMLMNHFLGRTSYNLNKLNDNMSSLLATLMSHLGSANGIAPLNANGVLDIAKGGTNASTVNGARTNLNINNVVNTGDSATPTENGTTKFTTGGAYTELNKKVDKSSVTSSVTSGNNDPVTSGGVYNFSFKNVHTDSSPKHFKFSELYGQSIRGNTFVINLRNRESYLLILSTSDNYAPFPPMLLKISNIYTNPASTTPSPSSNKLVKVSYDLSTKEIILSIGSYTNCTIRQIGGVPVSLEYTEVTESFSNSVVPSKVIDVPEPTTDGNYALQCKVASGVPAFSWDMDTPTAVPSDATLHYSFDDVPDFPDGTAVYYRNKNFASGDGWDSGSNTVTYPNGILTIASVGAVTYVTKNVTSGNIIKSIVTSSVDTTIFLYANIDGTNSDLLSQTVKANIPTEFIVSIPSGTLARVGFYGLETSSKFEITSFYIGDGSYSTPIIDNSGDNINAVNNGGIAVQGVCGKGVYLMPAKRIHIPNFYLTTDFTVSLWVKPDNNTTSLVGYLFANWSQLLIRNGEHNDDKFTITLFHSSSSETFSPTNALLTPNVWNNIVVVKEGNILTVFINGVKYTKTLSSSSLKMENLEDSYLGSQVNTRPQTIDDLLIFNRALSEDEVTALYLNKANTPKFYNINNYLLDNRSAVPAENGNDLFTTGGAYSFFGDNTSAKSWLGKVFGWALGRKWTAVTGMTSEDFYCFYYANGIYVACGTHGLWYSIDGKTWTQVSATASITFYTVYYANGIWVAGSASHGLWWSTDGKTWTAGTGSMTSYAFSDVHYANGIWVSCSNDSHGLWWSTDGKAWTQVTGSTTSYQFRSVYYDSTFPLPWVACSSEHGLWYSTDGKAWTQVTGSTTSYWFDSVYSANGIWVACSASHGLWWSSNTVDWTQVSATASYSFNDLYYANGIWVACSASHGLWWSTDGKNWTQGTVTSLSFLKVYYANGIWVAGSVNNGLWWSTDGKSWNRGIGGINFRFDTVYSANGIWLAGSSNTGLWYSDYSNTDWQ